MNELSEEIFSIDIIMDSYNTKNPNEIVNLCKEILDIKVSKIQVLDRIHYQAEDYEKESRFIQMKQIFK